MAYQPLYVIHCQIYVYTYKVFYFKQFSLTKGPGLVLNDV